MSIVHDPNHDPSSARATYEWLYVAPELAMNIITKAINIRLLRSRSETIDNNQL
jgi:hypothetical protein